MTGITKYEWFAVIWILQYRFYRQPLTITASFRTGTPLGEFVFRRAVMSVASLKVVKGTGVVLLAVGARELDLCAVGQDLVACRFRQANAATAALGASTCSWSHCHWTINLRADLRMYQHNISTEYLISNVNGASKHVATAKGITSSQICTITASWSMSEVMQNQLKK